MSDLETNVIYCGDCLVKLKDIPDNSVDLIYIDPPFSSNRNYVAFWQEQEKRHFEDRFENVHAYIDYMRPRLIELYRVLKDTGSFYYHCDWHAAHYIKALLDSDYLFGYKNFQNEIIWYYTVGGKGKTRFARKHDNIFFYTKGKKHTFNGKDVAVPMKSGTSSFGGRLETDEDGRKYRLVYGTKNKQGEAKYYKYYLDEGKIPEDVWQIESIQSQDKIRSGYPTQKPPKLLERIIKASSNKDNIILDAFCGCGTTIIEAEKLGRKWIGIDISPTACRTMADTMEKNFTIKEGTDFFVRDMPKTAEELRAYPAFEFQNWAVNALGGIASKMKTKDMGIDGKLYPIEDIPKAKKTGMDLFGDMDRYIPIQVKRTDQVGRPDIDNFETAMKRDKRIKGIFVGFSFSKDAEKEVRRIEREEGLVIEMITVDKITEMQMDKRFK